MVCLVICHTHAPHLNRWTDLVATLHMCTDESGSYRSNNTSS